MNKLFTKIATAFVGMAMAVGVGVAFGVNNAKGVSASTSNFTLSSASSVTQDGITVTFNKSSGSTAPTWYAAGLRLYANNTVEITSSSNITGVSFNWEKQGSKAFATVTADVGSYSHPTTAGTGTWSGSANTVVFTLGSSGQLQLNTFSVDYSGSGPVVSYTITYDANGGSGEMSDTTNTVAACTFTAPEGKKFSEWNTAADGSGDSYAAGDPVSSDVDLFAIWVDKPLAVTLDKIGTSLGSTANTEMATVDIDDDSDTYTLNYLQCKKQGDAMFMTKDVNPFISNHTEMPGSITSIEVFINSGASAKTNYDVAFGTSEFTTATAGIGDVNIAGGASHVFENSSVDGATYFCITLGNSNNGQVLKIVVNYELPAADARIVDTNGVDITSTFNITEGYAPLVRYYDEDDAAIEDATWVAADDTVIQIMNHNSYVLLKGLKVGTTTVCASKSGYKKSTITVQVVEDPSLPEMEIWDNTWKLDDGSGYWWSSTADLYWFFAHPEGDTEKSAEDRTILDGVTWASSDETVATITTQPGGQGSITTLKPGETTLTATKSGYQSCSVRVVFNAGAVTALNVTGSMSKTSYTTSDSWDPSGLVVKAYHDNTGWEDDVTSEVLEWTYNPVAPVEGVTSVVATAKWNDGENDFYGSSTAQAVTVTVQHAGTADDPFTVAEALAKANEIGTVGSSGQGPWVTTGIITRVTSAPAATYWNATYYISDTGAQENELQVYRGYYLDNAKFDAETALLMKAGMVVTITGNLTGSYGCEYCQGNYLLSIEEPSSGDVNVTFEPKTSMEIGETGSFASAVTTDASDPTITYSVETGKEDILSVNSSTGAYEVLGLGSVKVTVTVTDGSKQGTAFANVVCNGSAGSYYSVSYANAIASGVASGQTTPYYIYVEGYVKEFATSSKDGKPRALDIMTLDEESKIMVYTNIDPYADFIDGLSLGDRIVVKGKIQNYSGTYEIVEPEKVASNASAITFALDFISQTDAVCKDYDGKTDNTEALEAIWSGLATSYSALYDNQKSILWGATAKEDGTNVEQAVARYDYLVVKYGLDNFISGRTPTELVTPHTSPIASDANTTNAMIIVTVIALTSVSAIAVLLVIKRRKTY